MLLHRVTAGNAGTRQLPRGPTIFPTGALGKGGKRHPKKTLVSRLLAQRLTSRRFHHCVIWRDLAIVARK